MAVKIQPTIDANEMILKYCSAIIFTSKKVIKPPMPSAMDLTVPVIWGLMDLRTFAGTGSHSSSNEELLMVNLKV